MISATRRTHRLGFGVIALGAAAGLLSACGGGDDDDASASTSTTPSVSSSASSASSAPASSSAPAVPTEKQLTKEQLQPVLLTAADIAGLKEDTSSDDTEDDSSPGCLSTLDSLDDTDKYPDVSLDLTDDDGVNTLSTEAESYPSSNLAAGSITAVRTALATCTTVDVTQDGTHVQLTVKTDGDTDKTLHVLLDGSIAQDGDSAPFSPEISIQRIDNNVIGATTSYSGHNPFDTASLLTEMASRLATAVQGASA
jgi:hypothetical protein